MTELNIKSSTIEKGLELAKDFLGKLISPTVEEGGKVPSIGAEKGIEPSQPLSFGGTCPAKREGTKG
jgi:hypothetical protein